MSENPDLPAGDELARLDAQIPLLRQRYESARREFETAGAALRDAEERRRWLTTSLVTPSASVAATAPTPPEAVVPAPISPAPVVTGPEASTRTVQNVLFILGGILLGTAAIVFTAVAWATFGVAGRAMILAVVTALAFLAPVVALKRGLRATAETFAAVGLLLLALDGYASWQVNLLGVQALRERHYIGIVLAVIAAFAFGYGQLTRLAGPAVVAVVAAQPVAPLLISTEHPTFAGTSLLASGVAAANALAAAGIVRAAQSGTSRRSPAVLATLRFLAFAAFSVWALIGGVNALRAEIQTDTLSGRVMAGVATVVFSFVLVLGAWASRLTVLRTVAAGAVVVAVAIANFATGAFVWPDHLLLLFAATALTAAVLVRLANTALPQWLRPGPLIGSAAVSGTGLLLLASFGLQAATRTVGNAWPFWDAPLAPTGPHSAPFTWELPLSILGVTVAALVVGAPAALAVAGWVLVVLALPASVALPWWAPPALDLAGIAVLAVAYLFARSTTHLRTGTLVGGAILVLDAVLTSTARPGLTALVLTGVLLLGVTIAFLVRTRTPATTPVGTAPAHDTALEETALEDTAAAGDAAPGDGSALADVGPTRRGDAFGAGALAVGLLAAPPAVGSALRALDVAPLWALRATVATCAVLLLAMVWIRRLTRSESTVDSYLTGAFWATVLSTAVWPLLSPGTGAAAPGVYSAVALIMLALAVAVLPAQAIWARAAALVCSAGVGLVFMIAVLPAMLAVSFYPYGWVLKVWAGAPEGVGLPVSNGRGYVVTGADAVAIALLAVASAVAAYAVRRRVSGALAGLGIGGPTAVLATVVAAGVSWPGLPFAALAVGLALLLPAAFVRGREQSTFAPWRLTVLIGQGALYLGAGVAGSLAARWSTLTVLGILIVAFAFVGAAGRQPAWRAVGCVVTVLAALTEAATAGAAADLRPRHIALLVLAVGALALFAGAFLRRDPARREEAVATEATSLVAPVAALVLGSQTTGRAALILAIWGLALAARAIVPGATRGVRSAYAAAGGGLEVLAWWLLLAGRPVPIEAYTLPLVAVTLFAGWARLRSRPEVRSWVAYGPALLAGFLPTLAVVLGTVGSPWRRLALGAAALVCVVVGAIRRRQAPVVVGGVVLVLVALHELALVWQLLPGWIPLAAGGAILIFLAITYERRRRDLTRVRSALRQMT